MSPSSANRQPNVTRIQPQGHGPLSEWSLSATDREIIAHLQEDGRRSFVAIARDLDISERTVRNRVHQLLENNVIQIVALTDPSTLGFQAGALVGITLEPGTSASAVAEQLIAIRDVDYVVTTTGRFRLFAELICTDMSRMQQVLDEQLASIEGIRGLEVYPYFGVYFQKASFFGRSQSARSGQGVLSRPLDDMDRRIVHQLSQDGRAPLKNVAEALEVSETQVRMRLSNLLDSGQLSIMAITSPMNLESRALAWIAITVRPGFQVREVAERLRALPEVSYISICAGRFDLFVEVVCSSNSELFDLSDLKIRLLDGIERLESFPYIDLFYKRLGPTRV